MELKNRIKDIFSYMPYGFQRVLVYPYAVFANRKGHMRDKLLLEYMEIDESMDRSFDRFKTLVNYAYEHVPYYRNTWKNMEILPEDIRSYSDIEKLPIIDKHTVIKHFEEFISDEADVSKLIKHSTGGSSGVSLTVLYDENTDRARRLGILRWMNFAGLSPYDKGVWVGRASKALLSDKKKWGGRREILWFF